MTIRKFFISSAILLSVVACDQKEIKEPPLYAQPKRRINAQMQSSYVGPANSSQAYNNPAMAQYAAPGSGLAALGQQGYQPRNVQGQLTPWSYLPAPSYAPTPQSNIAPMQQQMQYGGGMPQQQMPQMPPMPQYGGADQFGGGMPPMPQPPQYGGGGMMQQQMPQQMPPVQYGNPPMQQQQQYAPVDYGTPPMPGNPFPAGGAGGGGGMPPYQDLPAIQPPYPPSGSGAYLKQPYVDDYEQLASAMPAVPPIEVTEVEEDLPDISNLSEESNNSKVIAKIAQEKSNPYTQLNENDYDFSGENMNELFSFFDNHETVQGAMAQQPVYRQQQRAQHVQRVYEPPQVTQQVVQRQIPEQPHYQQQRYQQQPARNDHVVKVTPVRVDKPSNYRAVNISEFKDAPNVAAVNIQRNNYGDQVAELPPSTPKSFKVSPINRQKHVKDLSWQNAPKKQATPKSLEYSTKLTYPKTRYKEDFGPVNTRDRGTWYPKSMTRI